MPIAKWVFNNAQNIKTMNIEIANNDVIKNSTEDWDRAVSNTKKFIIWVCKELKVRINVDSSLNTTVEVRKPPVGEILLLRHYDFTGKMCPKPFIDNVQAWTDFVIEIAESVNI
jgi:N-acetylmuramoyl-L-alanine amidase CwlA